MGVGIEAARAGFHILRQERAGNIQAHGIPPELLALSERSLEKLSVELSEKLDKVALLYGKGTLVFLLTGEESPEKDNFAVLILMIMLGAGKVVRYYIATSFDTHEVGQLALIGIDMAKGLAATKAIAVLSTHLHNYKAAIISGETLGSIEAVIGKSLFDYMGHMAVEVKIPTTRDKILEV